MRPTHSSHAQLSTQATREPPSSAAQTIPVTHFKPHFVVGGGDCLFHALCMGSTNQLAMPVSMEHIMNLRQDAANYVAEHRAALISHPSFGGEAGVNALYGLLITQGQWNENAGDLVPPILARVLGREIRILEPTQHGDSYDANENRIFKPQDADTGLPPAKPDTGQPPMYLAHINNAHYEYLEPRTPQADVSPESIKANARPLPGSVELPSDASLSESSSIKGWLDLLLNEEKNNLIDDVSPPASSNGSSLGRVSSLSSLESYSSRGFLENFAAKDESSPTDNIGQPPRKKPRNAKLNKQKNRMMARSQHLFLNKRRVTTEADKNEVTKAFAEVNKRPFNVMTKEGKAVNEANKRVQSQAARNKIKKEFAEAANSRPFDTLKKEEQIAEVMRISQKTGYNPSAVRTTLNGGGNKRVRTKAARNEIMTAFMRANNRSFDTLKKEEQTAEVMRISRKTGYNLHGVRTTLTGGGNREAATQTARNEITKTFTDNNHGPFSALTEEEQAVEVTRISRKTGYNPSAVQTMLTGRGNRMIAGKAARNEVKKAFSDGNNRSFEALTPEEQSVKVLRISQETGYRPSAIQTTLNGEGNKQVETQTDRTQVTNAFIKVNDRPFETLTKEEQAAEVMRISQETGYRPSGIRTTLAGGGNKPLRTQVARNDIMKAFTNGNNRPFDALTLEEKLVEVMRIARKTGYNPSGVWATLNGEGNKQVSTSVARKQIQNAFIKTNDCAFGALTQDQQAAEVERISRETGYCRSGVRTTLNGEGNRPVGTKVARTQITNTFIKSNNGTFNKLTQDQQAAEVTRISRETGYRPSGVRTTLTGGGSKQVGTNVARTQITNAFIKVNDGPFEALTQNQQAAEVTRISRETGYNPTGVRTILAGGGNKRVRTQAAKNEITLAFSQAANKRPFDALTPEEQAAEVTRISRATGYNPPGVRATLTDRK